MTTKTAFDAVNKDAKVHAVAWKAARALSREHGKFYSVHYEPTGENGWDAFGRFVVVPA